MTPISPCDPNVVFFHTLVSKIWARTNQNGTFFDNCRLCARAKVRAKHRRKHFLGKVGRAFSTLVAALVSDLWTMAGRNGTDFDNNGTVFDKKGFDRVTQQSVRKGLERKN